MAKAQDIAAELLPHFKRNVLDRRVCTYGSYAAQVGRDPATNGLAIGQAMHAIGAVCVLRLLPIAPHFFVEATNGNQRQVFESNDLEAALVLPHFDLLYVVARDYTYTVQDLDGLENGLKKGWIDGRLDKSLHALWKTILCSRPEGSARTRFEMALDRYREIIQSLRSSKRSGP